MLTSSASVPSQTSFGNPRQIAAAGSVANQLMYTVPAGKKFQGTMHSEGNPRYVRITPSGGFAVTFPVPTPSISGTASSAF
jgi:hypothetical protein